MSEKQRRPLHGSPVQGGPVVDAAPHRSEDVEEEALDRLLGRGNMAMGDLAMGEEAQAGADGRQAEERELLSDPARLPALLDATAEVPDQDVIYEQLALAGAHGGLGAEQLRAWGYREGPVVENAGTGLRAVLYLPLPGALDRASTLGRRLADLHGAALRPVMAFRGAVDRPGAQADLHAEGVGSYQFAANEADILTALRGPGLRVDVVGHGLGGALAQLAACRSPQAVGRVVTYQAPAVDQADADDLRAWNARSPAGQEVRSTHHRMEGDPSALPGEELTTGEVYDFDAAGRDAAPGAAARPLAWLDAARGRRVPGVQDADGQPAEDRLVRAERSVAGPTPFDLAAQGEGRGSDWNPGLTGPMPRREPERIRARLLGLAEASILGLRQLVAMVQDETALRPEEKASLQEELRQRVQARRG